MKSYCVVEWHKPFEMIEREVLLHTVDSAHQVLLLLHTLDAHVVYSSARG